MTTWKCLRNGGRAYSHEAFHQAGSGVKHSLIKDRPMVGFSLENVVAYGDRFSRRFRHAIRSGLGDYSGQIHFSSAGVELNGATCRIRTGGRLGKGSLKQKCHDNFAVADRHPYRPRVASNLNFNGAHFASPRSTPSKPRRALA